MREVRQRSVLLPGEVQVSRRNPRVELHLDLGVLGDLFGIDVEHSVLQATLSGRPYVKLRGAPRNPAHTFADGDVVYGHVEAIEGGVKLGVHRLGEQWWVHDEKKEPTHEGV